MHFQGEVDNYLIEENDPDLEYVLGFLKQMNHETSSFCAYSIDDLCYIQCAGSAEEMTIEWREKTNSGFRQYVVGRKKLLKTKRKLKYSGGEIDLLSNEILNYEDGLVLFKAFFEKNEMPPTN